MNEAFEPSVAAAHARIAAVRPTDYARTRNALDGAVTRLSPYLTHGFVDLAEVLAGVAAQHRLDLRHKFVFELGWREYFHHVWQQRGDGILQSLHAGPLPDAAYATTLPADIRSATTGVPVVDQAVRALYASGYLHNHARMWLASYVVHLRKLHWRAGADWLYAHLLDGDLASNHLSWQWVAGTASHKPYLFDAANVARYAPPAWHSPGTVIDTSYEALDRFARDPAARAAATMAPTAAASPEPAVTTSPPAALGFTAPDAANVAGHDVWLMHPWTLSAPPADLPPGTRVIGLALAEFHQRWPWSERRWHFVAQGMAALAGPRWYGSQAAVAAALAGARSVHSVADPHLASALPALARCRPRPWLFGSGDRSGSTTASFSRWWASVTRGRDSLADLPGLQGLSPGPLFDAAADPT